MEEKWKYMRWRGAAGGGGRGEVKEYRMKMTLSTILPQTNIS